MFIEFMFHRVGVLFVLSFVYHECSSEPYKVKAHRTGIGNEILHSFGAKLLLIYMFLFRGKWQDLLIYGTI